jgi:hypothetical protein
MNRLKNFFKSYPELLSVPVALAIWVVSIYVLRWFDRTSGVFDAGIFQIIIFTVIQLFVYVSIAWMVMGIVFGSLRRFLKSGYKKEFEILTTWQKVILSYAVFFMLLFALVLLSHTLNA